MAEGKIRELLEADARIRLIAAEITATISGWAGSGKLHWEARNYKDGDLHDAFLVVSIADRETNARVFAEAETRHIFCNSVDDIPRCNCYASAVVRRGPLQIAISTAGNSPALAQRLRKEFEDQFGEEYGPWVRQLGEARNLLFENKGITSEARRKILHEQASAAGLKAFRSSVRGSRSSHNSMRSPEDPRKSS